MICILKNIIPSAFVLLCFLPTTSAQQTFTGKSTGIRGETNFTKVANYELIHPSKRRINIPEKETEEDIKINNPVDNSVPPFTGKISTVGVPELPPLPLKSNSPQNPQEFPCANFRALDDDGTSFPPDVNGAIGFDHLMVTLNTQVGIQNKQGGMISTTSLVGFWNGLGGHTDIFDPKITYDPYDKRWLFVCCASRESSNSALLVAVSNNWDPTGGWNTYTIKADPGNQFWFDYPSLGFNRNWITVGGYMFNIPGQMNTQRSRVWVINKADVYAGLPNITVPFFDRTDYFHISPAITYSSTDNTNWCTTIHNPNSSNSGFVRLFSITGTGANPVFNVGSVINVGASWSNGGVSGPQLGSATNLSLGDNRVLESTFRNGRLWIGNNVCLPATNPTTCAAQIISMDPVAGTAIENIKTTVDNTGATMNAYPTISVNSNNDIFFGYSTFRTTAYVTSTISYRRSGQGFFFYYYKPGEDWYVKTDSSGVNRWGDYSATYIDPEDDVTAWTIQEYTRPRVLGTSFWGTWWGKICPGSCTNDFALSAPYNSVMRKYEANNTIISTAQVQTNSFIKNDAGVRVTLSPGFKVVEGNKFQAYIEGCGGAR